MMFVNLMSIALECYFNSLVFYILGELCRAKFTQSEESKMLWTVGGKAKVQRLFPGEGETVPSLQRLSITLITLYCQ